MENIKYFEGNNGKYRVDYNQKKVFQMTPNGEKEIPNIDKDYRYAVIYGYRITKEEYQVA